MTDRFVMRSETVAFSHCQRENYFLKRFRLVSIPTQPQDPSSFPVLLYVSVLIVVFER